MWKWVLCTLKITNVKKEIESHISFHVFWRFKICISIAPTVEVSSVAPVKQAHRRAALQGGLQPAFIQALKKEILPGV